MSPQKKLSPRHNNEGVTPSGTTKKKQLDAIRKRRPDPHRHAGSSSKRFQQSSKRHGEQPQRDRARGNDDADDALLPTIQRLVGDLMGGKATPGGENPTPKPKNPSLNLRGPPSSRLDFSAFVPPLEKAPRTRKPGKRRRDAHEDAENRGDDETVTRSQPPSPRKKKMKRAPEPERADASIPTEKRKEGAMEREQEMESEDEEADREAAEEVLRRTSEFIHRLKPTQKSSFWKLRDVAAGKISAPQDSQKRTRADPTDLSQGSFRKMDEEILASVQSTSRFSSSNSSSTSSSEPSWMMESDDEAYDTDTEQSDTVEEEDEPERDAFSHREGRSSVGIQKAKTLALPRRGGRLFQSPGPSEGQNEEDDVWSD